MHQTERKMVYVVNARKTTITGLLLAMMSIMSAIKFPSNLTFEVNHVILISL